MEYNQASRPNVVTLFFGIAVALMLVTVLVANLFLNRIPQPQPTDAALVSQSQQPGYSYAQAATTETVHNKASVLLIAIISMVAAVITGITIISTISNRRIMRQIAQFEQPKGFNATIIGVPRRAHSTITTNAADCLLAGFGLPGVPFGTVRLQYTAPPARSSSVGVYRNATPRKRLNRPLSTRESRR
jgi:hypothetical protein